MFEGMKAGLTGVLSRNEVNPALMFVLLCTLQVWRGECSLMERLKLGHETNSLFCFVICRSFDGERTHTHTHTICTIIIHICS